MKKIKILPLIISVLLTFVIGFSASAAAEPKEKELQIDSLFGEINGTVVLKRLKTGQLYVYNAKRSHIRFTPESTFKVPNALIGLETGAAEDEYEVKRWDGTEREFEVWNRDHTLGSGMRHSVIWYYQELARDIGAKRMKRFLQRMNYGNQNISGGIDRFWLDSSLRISAREQAAFMEQLVEEELPFQKQVMKTVKRIMIDKEEDEYTIHGKTGTRLADNGLGWYVGFVETEKDIWVFAANADASGSVVKNALLECLEDMNLIP
jgi:beta-lactamase class D